MLCKRYLLRPTAFMITIKHGFVKHIVYVWEETIRFRAWISRNESHIVPIFIVHLICLLLIEDLITQAQVHTALE